MELSHNEGRSTAHVAPETLRFTTASIRQAERFDGFQHTVNTLFSPCECDADSARDRSFEGSLTATRLQRLSVAQVSTSAMDVRRTEQHIARLDVPDYLVKLQRAGRSRFEQQGREANLEPGDFVICSLAEPYRLQLSDHYEMIVLALTENTINEMLWDPYELVGRRMASDDPSCGVFSQFVNLAIENIAELPSCMATRLEANILDLLSGVIETHTSGDRARPRPAEIQIERIKAFIDKNLKERRLGPGMIAESCGISTRYLHKLFADQPLTLTRYIRERRLEACYAMLMDPRFSQITITEIALQWGFYDLPHMSRAFAEHFRISPSALRKKLTECEQ